jgi:uncharacterized integral membrane protein (TIGR00698 family)
MNISLALRPSGTRLGLAGCATVTAVAAFLAGLPALAHHGLGWLPLAVALGMVAGNLWPALPEHGAAGIALARGPIMRAGIALYGLSIGASELAAVGWPGPLMAAAMVASTLLLAVVLGRRLGLDRHSSLLVGAGTAICGAAAVAAADGVLGARARHVSAAVAVVVLFGTFAMYVLPLLYSALGLSQSAFGIWLGLTVHELGHVIAAAGAVGHEALATAVVEKMLRVLLLAPAVIALAIHEGRASGRAGGGVRIPLFVWGFCAAIAVNAAGILPPWLHQLGTVLAQTLLAVGLAALGAATRVSEIRQAGVRVWVLAAMLWAYMLVFGFALVAVLANRAA